MPSTPASRQSVSWPNSRADHGDIHEFEIEPNPVPPRDGRLPVAAQVPAQTKGSPIPYGELKAPVFFKVNEKLTERSRNDHVFKGANKATKNNEKE